MGSGIIHRSKIQITANYSPELKHRLEELVPFHGNGDNPGWQSYDSYLNEWDSGVVSVLDNGSLWFRKTKGRSDYFITAANDEDRLNSQSVEVWSKQSLSLAGEIVEAETLRIQLTQQVMTLDQRLHELDQSLFDSSKKQDEARQEIQVIKEGLETLEQRRIGLLHLFQLSAQEREELVILNSLANDILGLNTEIIDFLDDFEIDKRTILGYRDLVTQVRLQSQYGYTSLEVIENLLDQRDFRVLKETELRALSQLRFTQAELEECNLASAAILLQYARLTEDQVEILQAKLETYFSKLVQERNNQGKVINGRVYKIDSKVGFSPEEIDRESLKYKKDMDVDGSFFYQLLAQANLPEALVEMQIQIIENYFLGSTLVDFDIVFEYDLLANESLTHDQKQRLATVLVEVGSGFDCEYLLKFYRPYLSNQAQQKAEEKVTQNIYTANLKRPSLYQVNPQDLEGKEIHLITHPLFSRFMEFDDADAQLWEAVNENGQAYFEASMVRDMQTVFDRENSKESLEAVPGFYLQVMESMEEWDHYLELAQNPNVVVIFLFPKSRGTLAQMNESSWIKGEMALVDLLNGLEGDNIYYLESLSGIRGSFKGFDQVFLDSSLPDEGDIFLSGGYMKHCLDDSVTDTIQISGDNSRRLIEEVVPSTRYASSGSMFDAKEVESMIRKRIEYNVLPHILELTPQLIPYLSQVGSSLFDETGFRISSPQSSIESLEDVRVVLDHNQPFNEAYRTYSQFEYSQTYGLEPLSWVNKLGLW